MDKTKNKLTGNAGEEMAAEYLRSKNYQIIGRNIFYPFGEIDILAKDGETIIVVEVKTVRGSGYGSAADLVRQKKQHKLRLLASAVAQEYPNSDIRIDVVAINGTEIEHIKSAVCGV